VSALLGCGAERGGGTGDFGGNPSGCRALERSDGACFRAGPVLYLWVRSQDFSTRMIKGPC
jgi:hypothetical protein